MARYVLVAVTLVVFLCIVVTLVLLTIAVVALACMAGIVGVPLWLMCRRWLRRHGAMASRLNPVERLQTLYSEGKIDLFEFERRVARLIAIEQL